MSYTHTPTAVLCRQGLSKRCDGGRRQSSATHPATLVSGSNFIWGQIFWWTSPSLGSDRPGFWRLQGGADGLLHDTLSKGASLWPGLAVSQCYSCEKAKASKVQIVFHKNALIWNDSVRPSVHAHCLLLKGYQYIS
jgi:hypothetical protein